MINPGPTWKSLLKTIEESGVAHLTLIDPDPMKQSAVVAGKIAKFAEQAGSNGIMVGGSTAFGIIDESVEEIKKQVDIPVILFPGNVSGLSHSADAVFFMSLLNSRTTYWMIDAQTLAARHIKSYNLEPISMAYLVVHPGGTAGFVGDARLLPRDKPEIALGYSLAAQYMGFRLLYLEAGSGADNAVPLPMIKLVSSKVDIPLAIGGGINSPDQAAALCNAGADIIIQGTIIEQTILEDKGKLLSKTIEAMQNAKKKK
ncbi:MAG: geranylgeranylglyceryl/heptaprenylglyceryl phosphate synthase [Candidatus Thorarchaeota archaeon]